MADLRRDAITGLLNTTEIPNAENPLSLEEKQREIQRVRDFIKTRYPNADVSKLVISFSSKKPMDIVVLGPKGGEVKIIKDNGSGFQKSFLNLTYVKKALGTSFKETQKRANRELIEERKKLADVQRKSPQNVRLIDALKEKNFKKRDKKNCTRKKFLQHKTNRRT